MRIANPIYDSVFKHLMEDREIASGLIARLLGVEVVELTAQPQELTTRWGAGIAANDQLLRVFRIDFSAVIRLLDGSTHKVLIELQKAGRSEAVGRFRNYLGNHYAVQPKQSAPLPIIAIYLLGFTLNPALPVVIRVRRQYLNGITGQLIPVVSPELFIEQLTHDAVVVQIPEITSDGPSDLEQALQVFDQRHQDKNPHYLIVPPDQENIRDELVRKMYRMLLQVASDDETQQQMAVEDEMVNVLMNLENANEEREKERRLKEEALARVAELEARLAKLEPSGPRLS